MKSYHAVQIGILCFIWCNVATNKWVILGAALNGVIYVALSIIMAVREDS